MSATTELFANLRPHFKGELIRPDDPDYLIARRVWNSAAQRSPGLIARCADIADVQTVVRAAANSGRTHSGALRRPQPRGIQHLRWRPGD